LRNLLDDVLGAFRLLTRFPVPALECEGDVRLARGVWAYPLVGAVVGALGSAAWVLSQFVGFGPALSAGIALSIQILATGALHEDGLADFADGLGGRRGRDSTLATMRDSRIGTFGVLALIMVMGLRWGGIAGLALHNVLGGLICAALLGRLAMVLLLAVLAPARRDGLGAMVARPPKSAVLGALAISIVIVFLHLPSSMTLTVLGGSFAAAGVIGVLAKRAIGGYTGDVLGAAGLAAETTVLLILAAG
jgi:adenosylcobinamide-GDP ribazoletransferase